MYTKILNRKEIELFQSVFEIKADAVLLKKTYLDNYYIKINDLKFMKLDRCYAQLFV